MLEKLKLFINVEKIIVFQQQKQRQFINVKSTSKFNVETTLILGWL